MDKTFPAILFCFLTLTASATISETYCERSTEQYAIKYYTENIRFGPLKARAKSVVIRSSVTTAVIDGERYTTKAQAHITYTGSTGGDTTEVRYFEATIEDGTPRPSFVEFKEIKENKRTKN